MAIPARSSASPGSQKPDPITSAVDAAREARLWRNVLAQAVRDLCGPDERARNEVIRWLRTRDFLTVCDFAYVDPDGMKEQMANLVTMPLSLAQKYGGILRSKIISEE